MERMSGREMKGERLIRFESRVGHGRLVTQAGHEQGELRTAGLEARGGAGSELLQGFIGEAGTSAEIGGHDVIAADGLEERLPGTRALLGVEHAEKIGQARLGELVKVGRYGCGPVGRRQRTLERLKGRGAGKECASRRKTLLVLIAAFDGCCHIRILRPQAGNCERLESYAAASLGTRKATGCGQNFGKSPQPSVA